MDQEGRQEGRIKFKISRVATPDLAPDFSNLDVIPQVKFRQALQGPRAEEIVKRTIAALQQVATQGTGVDPEALPAPLRQTGLECQTMALLNGIQAWEGYDRVRDLIPKIPDIRRQAVVARVGDPSGKYSMLAIDEVLAKLGLLHALNTSTNPIQAARQLFTDHRFLGVGSTNTFHAYTVLPQQHTPDNPRAFALKVDSLGGRTTLVSPIEFLRLIIEKPIDENQVIYQVTGKI